MARGSDLRGVGVAALLLLATACAGQGPIEAVDGRGGAGLAGPDRQAADGDGRHVVLRGETLSQLAERYGVGLSVLARANGIEPPYHIYAGQILMLPERGAGPAADSGKTVVVQPGDTLAAIAARHKLKLGDIVAANPGIRPDLIVPGQRVRVPGDVAMPPAPAMSPEEIELVRQASLAKPPSLSGEGFIWPVRGRVVSRFGDKPDGTRNAGVNLAAPAGTAVLAAENGIVVYANDKVPGYGRMLLIRHAGGFTTAYAHNDQLLVKVGDRVRRGQKVATVGSTGGVRQPQLHFEIRNGRHPIDPQRYLPRDPDRTQVASSAS